MTSSIVLPQLDGMSLRDCSVSADGRYLLFTNDYALTPQVPTSQLRVTHVYRLDLLTGQLAWVSQPHAAGVGSAYSGAISADGHVAAYRYTARVDGVEQYGVVVKNLVTGAVTTLASSTKAPWDSTPALSADGNLVAFAAYSGDAASGSESVIVMDVRSNRIVYRVDNLGSVSEVALSADGSRLLIQDGAIHTVELASGKNEALSAAGWDFAIGGFAEHSAMSAAGRYVVFETGKAEPAATGGEKGIVRKDLVTGEVKVVLSEPWNTAGTYHHASISADGRFVTFTAYESLNGEIGSYIYVKDMETGTVTRLAKSYDLLAMGDGLVAFSSDSTVPGHWPMDRALNIATFATGGAATNVAGTPASDVLVAHDGSDVLAGMAGDDILFGGAGNDTIDGGAGLDLASFRGNRADYKLTAGASDGSWNVVSAAEGADTLSQVERLHFADVNVALDVTGQAGQAFRLYQAAFARTPDKGGLGFWITAMDRGIPLPAVAAAFVASDEFIKAYAANGNRAIVEKFYQNVLHRAGESSGIDFWTGVLDNKAATVADVLVGFSESAENKAALVGVMANGIEYTPYF